MSRFGARVTLPWITSFRAASTTTRSSSDTSKVSKPRASSHFHLKCFRIEQDRCAMKVTTDTILLGAWARMSDTSSNKERWGLDIGTGTGTISLMLLQRDSCLRMHAVELDGPSAEQAQENAANSPWGDRMEVMSCSIQEWAARTTTNRRYDFIVTNPPYYPCHNASSPARRRAARTTQSLMQEELLYAVDSLLADDGSFCAILPASEAAKFQSLASKHSLHIHRLCYVRPLPHRPAKRILLHYGRNPTSVCGPTTNVVCELRY